MSPGFGKVLAAIEFARRHLLIIIFATLLLMQWLILRELLLISRNTSYYSGPYCSVSSPCMVELREYSIDTLAQRIANEIRRR